MEGFTRQFLYMKREQKQKIKQPKKIRKIKDPIDLLVT